MTPNVRRAVFFAGAAGLFLVLVLGMSGLGPLGQSSSPRARTLGDWFNRIAVDERHVTNVVSAVNFDYRGLDTMGEEFILFAAVAGVALLLRERRGESERDRPEGEIERVRRGRSEVVRWSGRWTVGLVNLFGLYVIASGQLTPGGGFQGGVILGTGSLLIYLAENYRTYRRAVPKTWVDLGGAIGAGGFVLAGLGGLLLGGAFLANVLPLGQTGSLISSGTIQVINALVGLEVAAGFALLFAEFLEETRRDSERKRS